MEKNQHTNYRKSLKHATSRLFVFCLIVLQLLLSLRPLFFPTPVEANYLSKLEQQLNISNGTFSTTQGTDSPSDNSLGIINYDSSQYTSPTVYFEAVIKCEDCSGGNNQVSASLYDLGYVPQGWYDTDWDHRKEITIESDYVSGSGSHTNYPVMINLASDSNLASSAQTDGDDILFTDSSGTKLDHEIEKYTSSTGSLQAWVRIPSLSATSDTTLYMYYGNDTIGSQQNMTGAWTAYDFVQHLQETTTDATDFKDSTGNHDSSNVVITAGGDPDTPGIVDGAVLFDGVNDRIEFTSHADFNIGANEDFSLSVWFDPVPTSPVVFNIVNKGGNPGWRLRTNSNGQAFMQIRDGTINVAADTPSESSVFDAGWHFVTAVRNAGTDRLAMYYQGDEVDNPNDITTTDISNTDIMEISDNSDTFSGIIDEVRITKSPLDPDWIKTEYNNVSSPSTFYALSTEESVTTPVSVATVSTSSSVYTRIRTNSLTLDDGDYSVRFKLDATSGTAYLKAARLIVLQSSTSPLTDTQTQIELGSVGTTTSTSPVSPGSTKYYLFDPSKYSGTVNAYFEATLKTTGGTAYAQLYNRTNSTIVSESTISTTSTDYTRVRSPALSTNWDTLNSDEYEVRIYSSSGTETTNLANAKVIIDQSEVAGLGQVELYHSQVTGVTTTTNTSYTQSSFYNLFDPDSFRDYNYFKVFYEATLNAPSDTASVSLYNTTNSDIINSPANSELSVGATLSRLRTDNLIHNTDWPSEAKEFDTIFKSETGNTTYVHNSWLIIQVGYIDPSFQVTIEGVESSQLINGITTTVATDTTSIPFGNITFGTPVYASHKIIVTTNDTPTSYTVTVALANPLQGNYPANHIDPFTGNSATWTNPQSWTSPTGTSSNQETGWFGANTTDTNVIGWSSGSAKFGPLSQEPIQVIHKSNHLRHLCPRSQ